MRVCTWPAAHTYWRSGPLSPSSPAIWGQKRASREITEKAWLSHTAENELGEKSGVYVGKGIRRSPFCKTNHTAQTLWA